jgi:hypothetical protein
VSGIDEEIEAAHADQLRRAVASVTGFELRRQDNGTYQIVWMSELTGEALPCEDEMTLDDVERWVDENVGKDEH